MKSEIKLKKDLISVVMCNYNTPVKYLKESIDSVLNQTYSNFEFIIIDDGSTDDSLEFIKSYNDDRIKLFVNSENIGLAKSLNKGFEMARGEYIARMDSDDICYLERFEKQIDYMKNHPDTIVCGTWAKIIDENNTMRIEDWARMSIDDMESYRINLLLYNYPAIVHTSAFFNHHLILKYNIKYNEEYKFSQDYELWTRCSKICKCYILQNTLVLYRVHSTSISQSKRSLQKEYAFRIIQNQLDYLHLTLPKDIREEHIQLPRAIVSYDKRIKKWIKEIINANAKYKIYNQKKLKKLLWYYWSIACYAELSNSSLLKRIYILMSLSLRCKINLFKIKKYYVNKYSQK